jgi:hypothetical protein
VNRPWLAAGIAVAAIFLIADIAATAPLRDAAWPLIFLAVVAIGCAVSAVRGFAAQQTPDAARGFDVIPPEPRDPPDRPA